MSARDTSPNFRHGHAPHANWSPEYRSWITMRYASRKAAQSAEHGTSATSVCPEWDRSFPAFLAAVGHRPTPKHVLQRRDTTKGFEPGNVSWGLKAGVSRRGRNTTRYVEIDGRRVAVVDVAAAHGIRRDTLILRLDRGIPLEEAIRPPARPSASRGAQS